MVIIQNAGVRVRDSSRAVHANEFFVPLIENVRALALGIADGQSRSAPGFVTGVGVGVAALRRGVSCRIDAADPAVG